MFVRDGRVVLAAVCSGRIALAAARGKRRGEPRFFELPAKALDDMVAVSPLPKSMLAGYI